MSEPRIASATTWEGLPIELGQILGYLPDNESSQKLYPVSSLDSMVYELVDALILLKIYSSMLGASRVIGLVLFTPGE